jgi:HprK-related kinase B
MTTAEEVASRFLKDQKLVEKTVTLDLDGFSIALRSNSRKLLQHLEQYFKHVAGMRSPDIEVICIESEIAKSSFEYIDWKREPGKAGRKDAYCDLADARLVLKVRTGMLFLQHEQYRIAIGPCNEYDNQVINFINAQYMNWLQQNDALICHASGLVVNERCMAIAGFSGGGKSTLMLHMLDDDDVHYLTNDRLFLNRIDNGILATGIPKLPRINPGTIVNNPRLKPILDERRCEELLAMPKEELWHLEEKYDVDVEQVYGEGKIITQQHMDSFLILNWSFTHEQDCAIKQVDIKERPELLKAVMKSPGPFYQFSDGRFFEDDMELSGESYIDYLKDLTIFEATGKVDFDYASNFCLSYLKKSGSSL